MVSYKLKDQIIIGFGIKRLWLQIRTSKLGLFICQTNGKIYRGVKKDDKDVATVKMFYGWIFLPQQHGSCSCKLRMQESKLVECLSCWNTWWLTGMNREHSSSAH